ncbi:MAG TPA: hypothetical protein VIU93_04755 [Gallionellaceae bacterium]
MATSSHNISAPESRRSVVKLAGSMLVFLSATRHSSELPAKASMASDVSTMRRRRDMG